MSSESIYTLILQALALHVHEEGNASVNEKRYFQQPRGNLGRAIIGGRVSISRNNITLPTNEVKHILGLTLSEEEEAAEQAFLAARGQRS